MRRLPLLTRDKACWTQNMIDEYWMFNLTCGSRQCYPWVMLGARFRILGKFLYVDGRRWWIKLGTIAESFCSPNHQQIAPLRSKASERRLHFSVFFFQGLFFEYFWRILYEQCSFVCLPICSFLNFIMKFVCSPRKLSSCSWILYYAHERFRTANLYTYI